MKVFCVVKGDGMHYINELVSVHKTRTKAQDKADELNEKLPQDSPIFYVVEERLVRV